jgi:hypothetical protein
MITIYLADQTLAKDQFDLFRRYVEGQGGQITPEPETLVENRIKLANGQVMCIPTELLVITAEQRMLAEMKETRRFAKICQDFGFTVLRTDPET